MILREIQPQDLEGMFLLNSDSLVHRCLLNQPVKHRDESVLIIESIRAQYRSNGIGRWAVIGKQSGDCVGWSGLKLEDEPMNRFTCFHDTGYRLRPAFRGKGYARQRACHRGPAVWL